MSKGIRGMRNHGKTKDHATKLIKKKQNSGNNNNNNNNNNNIGNNK